LQWGLETWTAVRQVQSFFSKNESLSDEHTCSSEALRKFREAEEICRVTNDRVNEEWYPDDAVARQIRHMVWDIGNVLGEFRTFVEGLPNALRLTDGATEDRSRKRSFPFLKVTGRIRSTFRSLPLVRLILQKWGVDVDALKFEPTSENRVQFVPKNWKTHRSIACEPTHALPLQLAVDAWIKRRLEKWGIILVDQSLNQEKARLGSLDGTLATLDLRMASDTLAREVVALLVPDQWYLFLDAIRSTSYRLSNGDKGGYAKFSSMGNGFTFSLESLIFTAACRAVGSQRYQVYGDDIIIESELVTELVVLLGYLGFEINDEKSFHDPEFRFRESCGADWYNGVLVTPFHLRRSEGLTKADLCHTINGLLALSVPDGKLQAFCWSLVRKHHLPLVPYNGDTRSGIFIHPTDAYRLRKLHFDVNLQISTFRGYGPRSSTRTNRGWRTYFLWHLNAASGFKTAYDPMSFHPAMGMESWNAQKDSSARKALDERLGIREATEVSRIVERTKYGHRALAFVPVRRRLPLYLYTLGCKELGL
jgi:hypothetical protein